mgnify:CR=1 FL=1
MHNYIPASGDSVVERDFKATVAFTRGLLWAFAVPAELCFVGATVEEVLAQIITPAPTA